MEWFVYKKYIIAFKIKQMVLIYSEAIAWRCSVKGFFTEAIYKFADKVLPDACFLVDFPKLFRTGNLSNTCERLFLLNACKTLTSISLFTGPFFFHSRNGKKVRFRIF